ncbi:MAG: ribonuclease III [Phycisphaeraceae bacterium]|nr:ribonuclease III [Phycisphaeraceae bacterium]
MDPDIRSAAEDILGHTFNDVSLLDRALTHASIASSRVESNERLEFLGDAALGLIICEYLYRTNPDFLEGELTKIKSHVVSRRACAEIAVELGLDRLLLLGKGMSARFGLPPSVSAAVFESLIGALYLDAGPEVTRDFILKHMRGRVEQATRLGHQYNFKSALQQALLEQSRPPAIYTILDEKGPDHAKCFEVCVQSGTDRFPPRWGNSKKEAEQLAALEALRTMGLVVETDSGEPMLTDLSLPVTTSDDEE